MTSDKNTVVSATTEFAGSEKKPSELSSQGRKSPRGTKTFLALALLIVVGVGGFMTYKFVLRLGASTKVVEANAGEVKKVITDHTPTPVKQKPVTAEKAQALQVETDHVEAAPAEDPEINMEFLIRARMLNSVLSSSSLDQSVPTENPQTASAASSNALTDQLKPVELTGSSARVLPNRDMLITQGTMIDCTLETRIVSTQAGMTACYISRDVYSTSGRVVMLEKGSKVTGMYQNNLQQGQDRLFVQWSRVETPKGVVVNLDSPATGSLGEAGVGGEIDNHYGQRFGGAILVSLIGDVGNYVSQLGQKKNNSPTFNFDTTAKGSESIATEIIKNTINIPPTMTKNQGEHVSIFVARDLDFSKVYKIRAN